MKKLKKRHIRKLLKLIRKFGIDPVWRIVDAKKNPSAMDKVIQTTLDNYKSSMLQRFNQQDEILRALDKQGFIE